MMDYRLMAATRLLAAMPMSAHIEPDPNTSTTNLSEEEIAERDRPQSRQVRRQMERLRRKGRA